MTTTKTNNTFLTQSKYNSNDVSFTIERFCPGVKDARVSILQDQFVGVAYVEVDNPWAGAHGVVVHSKRHTAPGKPFIGTFMQCAEYPTELPEACQGTNKVSFAAEQTSDMSITTDLNTMSLTATRHVDSDEYKEFELHITKPPKACIYQSDDCASDCVLGGLACCITQFTQGARHTATPNECAWFSCDGPTGGQLALWSPARPRAFQRHRIA